jgi:hypothetical protein
LCCIKTGSYDKRDDQVKSILSLGNADFAFTAPKLDYLQPYVRLSDLFT